MIGEQYSNPNLPLESAPTLVNRRENIELYSLIHHLWEVTSNADNAEDISTNPFEEYIGRQNERGRNCSIYTLRMVEQNQKVRLLNAAESSLSQLGSLHSLSPDWHTEFEVPESLCGNEIFFQVKFIGSKETAQLEKLEIVVVDLTKKTQPGLVLLRQKNVKPNFIFNGSGMKIEDSLKVLKTLCECIQTLEPRPAVETPPPTRRR